MKQATMLGVVVLALAGVLLAETDKAGLSGTLVREAARQDSVNQRMGVIVGQLIDLAADLRSNEFLNEASEKELVKLAVSLKDINDVHVLKAAEALRLAMANVAASDPHVKTADREIAIVVAKLRELINKTTSAQQRAILLNELRDIILKQEICNRNTIDWGKLLLQNAANSPERGQELSDNQTQISGRVDRFMISLKDALTGETDAIMSIRLSQAHKLLTDRQVPQLLTTAAGNIGSAKPVEAVGRQETALKALKEAEKILRPDLDANDLAKAKEDLKKILVDQRALRGALESTMDKLVSLAKEYQVQQRGLTNRLTDVSPLVVEPEGAEKPAADNPIIEALGEMGQAEKSIESVQGAPAVTHQKKVEDALERALKMLDKKLAEMTKSDELQKKLEKEEKKLEDIKKIEEQQKKVKEETEKKDQEKKDVQPLTPEQKKIADDIKKLADENKKDDQPKDPSTPENKDPNQDPNKDPNQDPQKDPLQDATKTADDASKDLNENKPKPAESNQQKTLDSLKKAQEQTEKNIANLEKQLEDAQTSEEMKQLAKDIDNLAKQQEDINQETEKKKHEGKETQPLAKPQNEVKKATEQTAEKSPEDVKKDLETAKDEMEKSEEALAHNNPEEAKPHEESAKNALEHAKKSAEEAAKHPELAKKPHNGEPHESKDPSKDPNKDPNKEPKLADPTNKNLEPKEGKRLFAKTATKGQDVDPDKATWNSLTAREREALNQNFARELPTEYRQLLEDYYEALSK